ncbi:MAG: hypothetical protein R6W71_06185 [Bacteroidales bacterium]
MKCIRYLFRFVMIVLLAAGAWLFLPGCGMQKSRELPLQDGFELMADTIWGC